LSGRRFGDAASAPSRALGEHPNGGEVVISAGRYGPYVKYGKINAALPQGADPTTFSLEEAVALVAAKESGSGEKGGVRGRLLGEHPSGGAVTVRAGRFGPYVNWGATNATLKKGMSPESITLEEAVRLIEDKQAAGSSRQAKKTGSAVPRKAAKKPPEPRKPAAEEPLRKSKKAKRA